MLARAVKDAKSGNGHADDARQWLADEGAILADLVLDVPPDRVTRWAAEIGG